MSTQSELTVGVLALQGDFQRHQAQLERLDVASLAVRTAEQFDQIDGLIIPGGETTTMNILLDRFNMRERLRQFGVKWPIWGTCAGMIMLANHIEDNQAVITPLGLMDIDVIRNGYGRQVFSFEERLPAKLNGRDVELNATFIRAPRITRCGSKVQQLLIFRDSPVLVRQGNLLASSFHTELGDDTMLMRYFIEIMLAA